MGGGIASASSLEDVVLLLSTMLALTLLPTVAILKLCRSAHFRLAYVVVHTWYIGAFLGAALIALPSRHALGLARVEWMAFGEAIAKTWMLAVFMPRLIPLKEFNQSPRWMLASILIILSANVTYDLLGSVVIDGQESAAMSFNSRRLYSCWWYAVVTAFLARSPRSTY
eukprot:scaffold136448_cov40-Tisochrysis_lutea.AAC.3